MSVTKEQLWEAMQEPIEKGCFNCSRDEGIAVVCAMCHEHYEPVMSNPQFSDMWRWNGDK